MLGIIDVGGGMRGSFTAGIYDYLLDQGVQPFDYLIGVSAGSGNMITYLAKQRGRNLRFYLDYAFRKEYMSMHNMLRTGSYINLDYPYTFLSGPGGEDPVDLEAFNASQARYEAVVTDAATGNPVSYDKEELREGNFDPIKASCCVPGACRPYPVKGKPGFDGGIADPVPYRRALKQGCDRIVVLLTRPVDYRRSLLEHQEVMERAMARWPLAYAALLRRGARYNRDVDAVQKLELEGKALLAGPADIGDMGTLTKDKDEVERLYHMGYEEGKRVLAFAQQGQGK